jgi:NTE family protein
MTKTVALVLGSGGARGMAHIGVIKEIEARGYNIISVSGCSMGAVIGGFYCANKLEILPLGKILELSGSFALSRF